MSLRTRIVAVCLIVPAAVHADPVALVIADPAHFWASNGYVELSPAIKVSIPPGGESETAVYLKLPKDGLIEVIPASGSETANIKLPVGSIIDRVAMVRFRDGTFGVEDVRGTRWDEQGTEWFHVYRPSGASPNAPLQGYEWRRGNADEQRQATDLMTAYLAKTPMPPYGGLPDRRDIRQFRNLNNCAGCHQLSKPEARASGEPLPPWPTDARGLYVPIAVLSDSGLLSDTDDWNDPNAGNPQVTVLCGDQPAELAGGGSRQWFSCANAKLPKGVRNIAEGFRSGDAYAIKVCASRRTLYEHMTRDARKAFTAAFNACGLI